MGLRKGEGGYTLLIVLIIPIVFSAVFMAALVKVNHITNQRNFARRSQENDLLRSKIELLYSNQLSCSRNLVPAAFGTTLGAMATRSNQRSLQLFGLLPGNPGAVRVGSVVGGLLITELSFSAATPVAFAPRSFTSNLTVRAHGREGASLKPLVIPFYFFTNAAGVLSGCFVTVYPNPNAVPAATLEDVACQQTMGADYVFDPANRVCRDSPGGGP